MSEEQKAALKALVERLWNDVAGLPWKDEAWVNNEEAKKLAKDHFVLYTAKDLETIVISTAKEFKDENIIT